MGIADIRRTAYDVFWKADLGLTEMVKPDIKVMADPITSGTFGKVVLGKRILGMEGTVTVQLQNITEARIKAMMPWWSSGAVPLVPATIGVDYYDYATLLKLHPRDRGEDVDEDLNLVKACPISAYSIPRDNKKDDIWEVVFEFWPNRAKLEASPPVLEYGYIGAVPA